MARGLLLLLLLAVLAAACCTTYTQGVSNTQHETDVKTPAATPRTLVLMQSRALLQSHSGLMRLLKHRGHHITVAIAGEDAVKLTKFDTFNYDHLMIMAPSAEDLGEGISAESVSAFVDSGRSVLIMGGNSIGEPIRELAVELGIDIDEDGTRVQDHGAFAEDDADSLQGGQHDLVKGVLAPRAANFVGQPEGPVLFRGVGHSAQPSQFLTPVLTGSPTSFSAGLGSMLGEYPAAAGRDVLLVSALQTRGNARVVFSGSMDLFSNELMYRRDATGARTGNEAFVRELTSWAFHQRGLLRARKLTHFKVGAEHDVNPGSYRVQDNIHFSLVIEEYSGATASWVPFTVSDVQLEFTMLDPYIRMPLNTSGNGVYTAAFQVPDVYGVYKFVVEYRRAGYSNLDVASQVSVHPFRHNEFERFIGQAYPYYVSAFTLMAAFFTFGIVFLYQKE